MAAKKTSRPRTAARDTEIVIRPLEPRDLDTVIAIDAAVVGEAKPEYWRRKLGRVRVEPRRDEGLIEAAAEGGPLALVAEIDGIVVGFTLGEIRSWEYRQPPTGWITALEVVAEHRHRGVGRALLAEMLAYFRNRGLENARTMVEWSDGNDLAFYVAMGFERGPFIELEKKLSL